MRWWAFWRRVIYGFSFFSVCGLIGVGLYFAYGVTPPTCFDELQNGDERGVDCGGTCKRVCEFDIKPPTVQWSKSFKIIDGQYNAVAYIENRNPQIGTAELRYTFKLYDDAGLIVERKGKMVLPPGSVYPAFEGRLQTGARIPTKTVIEFDEGIIWRPGETGREQFTLLKRDLINADSKPRLIAQLKNNTLAEAQDVEVVATIFNAAREPLTAAATNVEYFGGRETKDITFTWPQPIAKTLRSCEIPTDVVLAIDLSGSMNNDSANPPEPLTSVLTAAESFVLRLGENDQISIVTYATNATTTEPLTYNSQRVAETIKNLKIDPKEEKGTTNTGDALLRMRDELSSVRHSESARKVAILLTDGLATAPGKDPETYARDASNALKSQDITLYTVGLGLGANDAFLKSLASSDTNYFKAPTSQDLGKIYTTIKEDICEEGFSVIEVIPKARTSFTDWN